MKLLNMSDVNLLDQMMTLGFPIYTFRRIKNSKFISYFCIESQVTCIDWCRAQLNQIPD